MNRSSLEKEKEKEQYRRIEKEKRSRRKEVFLLLVEKISFEGGGKNE